RRSDAEVDLLCARVADHVDDVAGRRSSHDGVVDDHHDAIFQHALDSIELAPDPHLALVLPRRDEGAANVVISDEADLEPAGIPQLLALTHETERTRVRRVGHGDHDRLLFLLDEGYRRLVRELLADLPAHFVDHLAINLRIRARKIHVLEDALADAETLRQVIALEFARFAALAVDHENLTRFDVADVFGADEVECTRLARHAVREAPGSIGPLQARQR